MTVRLGRREQLGFAKGTASGLGRQRFRRARAGTWKAKALVDRQRRRARVVQEERVAPTQETRTRKAYSSQREGLSLAVGMTTAQGKKGEEGRWPTHRIWGGQGRCYVE